MWRFDKTGSKWQLGSQVHDNNRIIMLNITVMRIKIF